MTNKNLNKYANRLVNAFLNNKIISPLPVKYTKKISDAQKLRRLCESCLLYTSPSPRDQ